MKYEKGEYWAVGYTEVRDILDDMRYSLETLHYPIAKVFDDAVIFLNEYAYNAESFVDTEIPRDGK